MTETFPDAFPAGARPHYEPAAVARVLVATGRSLLELLVRETGLLRASRTAEIAGLVAEKGRLSQVFAAGWRQFQAAPREIVGLPPELRAELREVALRVECAAVENEKVLRVGRRATELVVAAIARAREARRPRPTYTKGRVSRVLPRDHTGIGFSRSA